MWYGLREKCGAEFFRFRKKDAKLYDTMMLFGGDAHGQKIGEQEKPKPTPKPKRGKAPPPDTDGAGGKGGPAPAGAGAVNDRAWLYKD
jgi:hypothetical protein